MILGLFKLGKNSVSDQSQHNQEMQALNEFIRGRLTEKAQYAMDNPNENKEIIICLTQFCTMTIAYLLFSLYKLVSRISIEKRQYLLDLINSDLEKHNIKFRVVVI